MTPPASSSAPIMVVAVPRTLHCSAVRNEMPRPSTTRATPSAAPVVKAGSRAMIPAATATAPNAISTLIASDPVSRLASAWSRAASVVSLPSSTNRVMSRTILMAGTSFRSVCPTYLVSVELPFEDVPEPVTRSSKGSTPLRPGPPNLSGMRSPRRCQKELHLLGHQQGSELRGETFDKIPVCIHSGPMRATVGVIIEFPEM